MLNRITDLLSSLRITVVCLALLMILVLWGTLYQVEHGIWAAQQRFFYSWGFSLFGWIWLPGAQLVMAVLFVNLLAATVHRIAFSLAHAGLVLIHLGLLLMLAGGGWTHHFGLDAFLELHEGETSNAAASYRDWEIALWKQDGPAREVVAIDAVQVPRDRFLPLGDPDIGLRLDTYHPNARAFTGGQGAGAPPIPNATGIVRFEAMPPGTDPEKDLPGAMVTLSAPDAPPAQVLLYGGDSGPTRIPVGPEEITMMLRRKRYPLPLTVSLVDFKRAYHPNSQIPRSFSSDIRVDIKGVNRDAVVEMNRPFRYRDYTFFQASFSDLEGGGEKSVFAVTRNAGRLIPYVSTALVVLGLAVHFLRALYLRHAAARRAAG